MKCEQHLLDGKPCDRKARCWTDPGHVHLCWRHGVEWLDNQLETRALEFDSLRERLKNEG